jgi:hypothetical protein
VRPRLYGSQVGRQPVSFPARMMGLVGLAVTRPVTPVPSPGNARA